MLLVPLLTFYSAQTLERLLYKMSLRLQRMGFTVPEGEVIQETTPQIASPKKKKMKGKKRKVVRSAPIRSTRMRVESNKASETI